MIALIDAARNGLLARSQWPRNIVAGLIVGVVALPLSMAFAIASGARPEQGLYTAIVGGACVSLFGGSRLQIAGPTGAFIAILSGISAKYGIPGLQLATLLAGFILILLGITRMGTVIRFIPAPVIIGFTAGIGVIIFTGQCKDFFGLPAIRGEHFHERLWHLLQALPQIDWRTTALAALSLLLVIYTPRIKALARVPGPLVAMLVATAIQSALHLPTVATIGSAFGGIPMGLPPLVVPEVSVSEALALLGPAFTIAMLAAIESLLSAVVADGMAGTRHDSNQELVGQGIANVLAPLFGGFAATGAIARTGTNIRNGGNSPLAGVIHAITLLAILGFLAPLASSIPLATLAAILFFVAWNMSDVRRFTDVLWRAPRADRAILLVTFLLTVFVDLVVAVNVGIILAILQFMRRMTEAVEAKPASGRELRAELAELGIRSLPTDVMVYDIVGPMFFGAVENFKRPLLEARPYPKTLIIRLERVPFMDITAIHTLEEVIGVLRKRGVQVILCEANERVHGKLTAAGILPPEGPVTYCRSFAEALQRAGLYQERIEQPAAPS
jgi:SulP family sulfate permease